jgi:hypothetical protein
MKMTTVVVEEDGKKKYKRVPLEQTPEEAAADEAAIAFLDELRECPGEAYPDGLPLACIVKVLDYQDIPKANEAYALVRVEGADKRTWRMCVNRKTVKVGKNALFVSAHAALPVDPRFRNLAICKVKEKKYKFGFGVTITRLLPHVKRHIYPLNCGVLFPTSDFVELKGKRAGLYVSALLHIDRAEELKLRQQDPHAWALHYQP